MGLIVVKLSLTIYIFLLPRHL